MCIKDMIIKAIAKDMDDKIIKELDLVKWFELTDKQKEIVKKISEEYPYSIELVSGIYIEKKFSEEETRKILMMRMMGSR